MGQRPSVVSGDCRILSLFTRAFTIVGIFSADDMTRHGLHSAINLLSYDMT